MRPSALKDHRPSRSAQVHGTGADTRPTALKSRVGRGAGRRLPLLILIPVLAGLFGGPVGHVGADDLSDARSRQSALNAQLSKQKAEIAKINALQADLSNQIGSTKRELTGITRDLSAVRKSINGMIVKINVVKQQYLALVAQLELLDTQLDRVKTTEMRARWHLAERKEILADRLRQAYDTDRTSLLETFLSGGSFTDVLSEVSYSIDMGEQDKALAEQISKDQETLAAIHETVVSTRTATEELRVATVAQKAKLDKALAELKDAQKELKRLEAETKRALEIQQAAYRKLGTSTTSPRRWPRPPLRSGPSRSGSATWSPSSTPTATSRRSTTAPWAGRWPAPSARTTAARA